MSDDLIQGVRELIGPALRSIPRSLGLWLLGTAPALYLAWRILSHSPTVVLLTDPWLRGLIELLVMGAILLGCLAVGPLLVLKRALLIALLTGGQRFQIGRRAVQKLFSAILIVDDKESGAVGRAVERLPLAQAEARLREAVAGLQRSASADGVGSYLLRHLHALLIGRIEHFTLARFRAEGSAGVDLGRLRDELAAAADEALSESLTDARQRLTVLVVLGMIVGSSAATWVASHYVLVMLVARHGG